MSFVSVLKSLPFGLSLTFLCIMLPSVFPRYVKYKMNAWVFSHLGEIAAETGGCRKCMQCSGRGVKSNKLNWPIILNYYVQTIIGKGGR